MFVLQLEKQQKKLEAKGIMVEIAQLRQEWEAARNGGKGGNNEPILEHEIDVVGDDSEGEEEAEDAAASDTREPSLSPSSKPLPAAFSIDNLLASRQILAGHQPHLAKPEPAPVVKEEIPQ